MINYSLDCGHMGFIITEDSEKNNFFKNSLLHQSVRFVFPCLTFWSDMHRVAFRLIEITRGAGVIVKCGCKIQTQRSVYQVYHRQQIQHTTRHTQPEIADLSELCFNWVSSKCWLCGMLWLIQIRTSLPLFIDFYMGGRQGGGHDGGMMAGEENLFLLIYGRGKRTLVVRERKIDWE